MSFMMSLIPFNLPRSSVGFRSTKATPAEGLVLCVMMLKPESTFNKRLDSKGINIFSASFKASVVRSREAPAGIDKAMAINP
ncbi:hypothetical protein D3C86_1802970 [compost metagenome]